MSGKPKNRIEPKMKAINLFLPPPLLTKLNEGVKLTGLNKSDLARRALDCYLDKIIEKGQKQ